MKKPLKISSKPTVTVKLELDSRVAELLAVLDDEGDLKAALLKLADHAQQGVYRPGAWEREWICQAFGTGFVDRLVPGDPYGRDNCEHIFHRPRRGKRHRSPRRSHDALLVAARPAQSARSRSDGPLRGDGLRTRSAHGAAGAD